MKWQKTKLFGNSILYEDKSVAHGIYKNYHVIIYKDDGEGMMLKIYGTSLDWTEEL